MFGKRKKDFEDFEERGRDLKPQDVQEYIYSMTRSLVHKSTDFLAEDMLTPSGKELQEETSLLYETQSILPLSKAYTTTILASLVPDEVIYNVNDYSPRQYEGCVLVGDISGFTDLSERYHKRGPSRFTAVLNVYIGKMVQEIMSHGGDIHKFSGDAFLAVWKTQITESMTDIVHQALDCSLIIQKTLGQYETDVGVFLRVKLAIACGCITFSLIGDSRMSYYVCVGQPISDVKIAQEVAQAGEIIVAPSASLYLGANEYLTVLLKDNVHLKITGKGPNWKSTQKSTRSDQDIVHAKKTRTLYAFDFEDEIKAVVSNVHEEEEGFLLRPSVNAAVAMNIKDDLRKFIIPPVMRGIDLDEPLEYLTEMRQMVIMFINLTTIKLPISSYVKLIEDAYKLICGIAHDMQGCVNKVTTFDKDLMFVVLFGLRGYKHELESQTGLRCASDCFQALSEIQEFTSVSIGVTTGMTYCGVVGHALRREYTVMSLTVNKAARLMCAYPNKITCDRDTFLHSKLEAKNFIVQETVALKGISNVGTIFEFKEAPISQGMSSLNPFPILGKGKKLRLYKSLLMQFLDNKTSSDQSDEKMYIDTIVINGEMRQGKTRLLEEMVFSTPANIPVNKFTLRHKDNKCPFRTLFLIFSRPLGLNDSSSVEEREKVLIRKFGKTHLSKMLCALNPVFGVNFDYTPSYLSLDKKEQNILFEKVLRRLATLTFTSNWVIAIDDADYIDDESWTFYYVLTDTKTIFFILTWGNRKLVNLLAQEFLNQDRVKRLDLLPIKKMYHAGLACQILQVYAIPLELEKILQSRSNGNPGWIENFLVSLIQSGALLIEHLSRKEIHETGLISPPANMMIRSTGESNDLTDDLPPIFIDIDKDIDWELSKDNQNILNSDSFALKADTFKSTIPVSIFSANYKMEEIYPETPMDVRIIKTFDSLTSYEQLLLKCSSVLGETFNREMLLYTVATTKIRATALAIQNLFEIQVLRCAQGDFVQNESQIICRQFLKEEKDFGIKCKCIGIEVHSSCRDLPVYASCGYMKFVLPEFCLTTYNLLTENQKKEFHLRAIQFLEKETRRCRACGGGLFVKILGMRNDDGLLSKGSFIRNRPTRKLRKRGSTIVSTMLGENDRFSIANVETLIAAPNVNKSSSRKSSSIVQSLMPDSFKQYRRKTTDAPLKFYNFGIRMIRRLKNSLSLTRTFSYANFDDCKCPLILTTIYTEMIHHCKGAGSYNLLLAALLEYAHLCILYCNIPQAIGILDEAKKLLDHIAANLVEELAEELSWKLPLIHGKIQTLQGQSRYELGQIDEALSFFIQALSSYGFSYPKNNLQFRLQKFCKSTKLRYTLYFSPRWFLRNIEGYEAEFCDNVSQCLTFLCNLFKDIQQWKHAEFAAIWSLNHSLKSGSDFQGTCKAFANMIEVSHRMGQEQLCVALEVHALRFCHRKRSGIEIEELKTLCKLYAAIFIARFLRAELNKTIHIGTIMLGMCTSIPTVVITVKVLSLLVHALILKKNIMEACSVLQQLEYYSNEDKDNTGKTWYYALCMVVQLESGYTIESFRECELFYQMEFATFRNFQDQEAKSLFYTVIWLWCLRHDQFEAARLWFIRAKNAVTMEDDLSLDNIFTLLYRLEGQLLYMKSKIDGRDIHTVAITAKKVKFLFRNLQTASKANKMILPRLHHYKAYYKYIFNKEHKAYKLLATAKKIAKEQDNLLELEWIKHSYKAWKKILNPVALNFWTEHCKSDNLIDFHRSSAKDALFSYTLPTPKFY